MPTSHTRSLSPCPSPFESRSTTPAPYSPLHATNSITTNFLHGRPPVMHHNPYQTPTPSPTASSTPPCYYPRSISPTKKAKDKAASKLQATMEKMKEEYKDPIDAKYRNNNLDKRYLKHRDDYLNIVQPGRVEDKKRRQEIIDPGSSLDTTRSRTPTGSFESQRYRDNASRPAITPTSALSGNTLAANASTSSLTLMIDGELVTHPALRCSSSASPRVSATTGREGSRPVSPLNLGQL